MYTNYYCEGEGFGGSWGAGLCAMSNGLKSSVKYRPTVMSAQHARALKDTQWASP